MSRAKTTIERAYNATLAEAWALWTTAAGLEAWWGPEGFAVTVTHLDLRPGGELRYVMTAVGAEQIEFMRKAGMPLAHDARVEFREVEPERRLVYVHDVDFVPGVPTYQVETIVELRATPTGVHLTLQLDAMHDELWTARATAGWHSELGKLARAIDAAHAAG